MQDDELYMKLISACLATLDGCLGGKNKQSVAAVDKPDTFSASLLHTLYPQRWQQATVSNEQGQGWMADLHTLWEMARL